MKRIAVIGCSHSNHHSCDDIWAIQISRNHNVHIDNYATSGHGVVYFDFVLKYIIANKIEYDCVILQHTGRSRWSFPIEGTTRGASMIYNTVEQNYSQAMFDTPRANMSTPLLFDNRPDSITSVYNDMSVVHDFNPKTYKRNADAITENFAAHYFDNFIQSIDIYASCFDNFFHFAFSNNNAGNIGLPNFESWLAANHGDVMKYYDKTRHLTSEGNTILYSEYIMNSPIGNYLRGIE